MQSPVKRNLRFEPTERLSVRKRNLFPSQKDEDSDGDLGNICPIEVSSSPDRYDSLSKTPSPVNRYLESLENKNYDKHKSNRVSVLFEHLKHVSSPRKNRNILSSPEMLSASLSPDKENTEIVIPETPVKESPTQGLKTPHESVNTNKNVPKLIRKSLADTSMVKSSFKRKYDSPSHTCSKSIKLDSHSKISRARTALFTENMFPAKTFYPKSEESGALRKHYHVEHDAHSKRLSKKDSSLFLCNRKRSRMPGQINAGVRHKIRKPRHKNKFSKTQIMKAAISILDNSPLNQYLAGPNPGKAADSGQVNGLSLEQIQKMDLILKNIDAKKNYAQVQSPLQAQLAGRSGPDATMIQHKTDKASAKRSLSPQEESKKKFFKSHRTTGIVTINKNMKLRFDNGEMSLIDKHNKYRRAKLPDMSFDASDLSLMEDKLVDGSFTEIIKCLEEPCEPTSKVPVAAKESTIVLTAHSSVTASENSIQLHTAPRPTSLKQVNEMLLSPTTLMCDMTSGLALNSPKSQATQIVNLNKASTIKKHISFPDEMPGNEDKKLFPIFYADKKVDGKSTKELQPGKDARKIWKPISEDQYLIDAGQKRFGATQCIECGVVYHLGDPDDETMHFNYHNSVHVLRFNGWRNERVVREFHNGKIIQVNPFDPKPWWKKVRELLEVVNKELGFYESQVNTTNSKVYLYIINKRIVGCVVAEPRAQAHRMLPTIDHLECCSEESFPIKCGIARIWVSRTHRRTGLASTLLDVIRANFIFGHILSLDEMAFSSPTEMGKQFATKYMKTDRYLVYM